MRPTRKKLSLSRETVRTLGVNALAQARGAIMLPSSACPPPPLSVKCHSLFDSCHNSDCCLEVP